MDWQDRLITVYCNVCDAISKSDHLACLRVSRNRYPRFTDAEVLSIFYAGIMEGHHSIKAIHRIASSYWSEWFPLLPQYKQFVRRLHLLSEVIGEQLEQMTSLSTFNGDLGFVMDSLPIILATNKLSSNKRKLDSFCNKGYCASKDLHYYGAKLHLLAERSLSQLPSLFCCTVSQASEHDLTHFKIDYSDIRECEIYLDKAYCHQNFQNDIALNQGVLMATPIKKKPKQEFNAFEKAHNTFISHIRQPIEALFADIDKKTSIQKGCLIRSVKGLFVHIFGRLVAYGLLKRATA